MTRPLRADARRNRERLLAVASQVLSEQGADASLEEIAQRAEVGIGTLYRHFPTRQALLEAAFRRNVEQLCESAEELAASLPPEEALAAWMQRFVAYVATKKGLATYLKSVVSVDDELFVSSHQRVNATAQRLLQAAIEAGAVRSDVDPADLLRALSGVCLFSDAAGDRVCTLLMDGLRYGAGRSEAASSS